MLAQHSRRHHRQSPRVMTRLEKCRHFTQVLYLMYRPMFCIDIAMTERIVSIEVKSSTCFLCCLCASFHAFLFLINFIHRER